MKKLFLTVATAAMMFACTNNADKNPFLTEWNTPQGVPPFEQIKAEHYLPAFEEGIKQQQAEIEAIINNPEAPTFENTLEAMDKSGRLLSKVALVFFNITESDGSEELTKVQEVVLPLVSAHSDNIYMNARLFERVKAVYEGREAMNYTVEQTRLLEKVYNTFVRNGISLPEAEQARMREINAELSTLQQKFGNNLLAETNAFQLVLESEEDLAGLPEAVRTAAAEAAKAAGMEGKWVIGLQNPSRIPFLQYSERRDLREKVYKAYINRGNNGNENDNKELVLQIIKLRIEKANLLGFETSADFILDDTMAKKSETVNSFLLDIFNAANEKAKAELAEMQAIADREGNGVKVEAWDWDYYTEKVRQEKYAMSEDEIKPYFQMENVRAGMFALANRLYGLSFRKLDNMPLFNPEAECFEVTDKDGSLIGIFYTDYFPRASKRQGAWMTNLVNQSNFGGNETRPFIVNVCNFTAPQGNIPALLNIDETRTLFHEFGHALHGLLTKAHYPSVSGTSVKHDFVELFSQVNEKWSVHPTFMREYAKHYATGEIIPDSLIEKMQRSAHFNSGFETIEVIAAALLDMKMHLVDDYTDFDCNEFEKQLRNELGFINEIEYRYRSTNFSHVFGGGYEVGYYSYIWAEVLDCDAFELFEQRGIFDAETAASFKQLLEMGGSKDPMREYRRFRGAAPDPAALLRSRGLI